MKKIILFFFLITNMLFSQDEISYKMGQTTLDELKMTAYEKDTNADAVVLEENSQIYINVKRNYSYTLEYYVRIKFFNKNEIDRSIIKLPNHKYDYLRKVKAITYNLNENGEIEKSELKRKNTIEEKGDQKIKTLILPNVKANSVIEYKFSLTTSNYGIYDKYFQKSIPVKLLNYKFNISGYPQYYIQLVGPIKPNNKKQYLEKRCKGGTSKCYTFEYQFKDLPAFKKEKYVSNTDNYISRLYFEREYSIKTEKGIVNGWEAIDYILKKKYTKVIKESEFLKRKLPALIYQTNDKLEKAKKTFYFVQDHYNWNNRNNLFGNIDIKDAFNKKEGSLSEINLTLYKYLDKLGYKPSLLLLSTKRNGFLTKLYPSPLSLNYLIVRIFLNNKYYYLDASQKHYPFNQIPSDCFNGDVRVFDLKKVSHRNPKYSYWDKIKSNNRSIENNIVKLSLNKNENFEGKLLANSTGYFAQSKREKISSLKEEKYTEEINFTEFDFDIENYEVKNLTSLEKPLQETLNFKLLIDKESDGKILFNPILLKKYKENPFKLDKRSYPIDFYFIRKNNYSIRIDIPDNYKIVSFPKNISSTIANNGGNMIFKTLVKDNIIKIFFSIDLNKKVYPSSDYESLKDFFNKIIEAQNSLIILQKN